MLPYRRILIIYNPNSTGNSPRIAKHLYKQLLTRLPKIKTELIGTKHAGQAEELAYKAATKYKRLLLVSVSGDGGYNEVINGALRAATEKNVEPPICVVAPGGNANDHYKNVARRPVVSAICDGHVEELDVLQVSYGKSKRYAHSYVGLGLTPIVAKELNEHTLTAYKELWYTLRAYWRLRPFEIQQGSTVQEFDSILMTNVQRMAKHLTLSKQANPADGTFRLLKWPHQLKLRLTLTLLRAALGKPVPNEQVTSFKFITLKPQPAQLDGELMELPANITVSVNVQPRKLRTVL